VTSTFSLRRQKPEKPKKTKNHPTSRLSVVLSDDEGKGVKETRKKTTENGFQGDLPPVTKKRTKRLPEKLEGGTILR